MIDAKSLRIGNLVRLSSTTSESEFEIVDGLMNNVAADPLRCIHLAGNGIWNFESQIDPIPLTPDILIKSGFVNTIDVHWCVPSEKASNSFELCLWTDHVSYTKGNNHHVEINYLHQLQNLYYSLTQTELNIQLP